MVQAEGLNWTSKVVWSSRLEMLEVVTLEETTSGAFALRLVSNPESIRIGGLRDLRGQRGLRRRRDHKLYSVFEADFARQGAEAADFHAHLEACRERLGTLDRRIVSTTTSHTVQ